MKRLARVCRNALALAVSTALLVTCAAPSAATPTPTTVPGRSRAAQQAADAAVADLSARLMVAPSSIQVLAIEPHTWPDTSLGLPEPGQSYAQVTTSGYIVTLAYTREVYVYHVAGDIVRLDQSQSGPVPSGPIATPP